MSRNTTEHPSRRRTPRGTISLVVLVVVVLAAWPAMAQTTPPPDEAKVPTLFTHMDLAAVRGSVSRPTLLGPGAAPLIDPLWTDEGLWAARPQRLYGLDGIEKAGIPTYDPSSAAWYASANGALVRLEPDGRLVVIVDNVQGIDVDVRASAGVAVSREPNHTIVVHRWAAPGADAAGGNAAGGAGDDVDTRVVLRGAEFFYPRLSPDGSRIVVSGSDAEGGRIWILDIDGAVLHTLRGNYPAWHPDGRTLVFARVEHDGHRLQAADLWLADTVTQREEVVAVTPRVEIEPSFSPTGDHVAFVDAHTGEVYVAAWPGTAGGE